MAVAVVAPTGARYARIACATSLLGTTMLLNSNTIPVTYVPFAIFDTSLIDTDNIGYTQKTRLGEKLSIIQPSTGALPDIDIINKKITFPDDTILVWGKSNLILNVANGNNVIDFSGQASSAVAIYLDTKTLTFSALNYASGSGISENNVLLCTFRSKNGLGSFPGKYTVNGVDIFGVSKKKAVESPLVLPAKTRLAGHRGLRNLAPENTLASFDLTGQKGLFAIETDIYETTDGVFVCIHDSTVDAMTNGTGNVRDYTFAQLQQFTIDSGTNIANYSNLKIPRIEDYLKICRKYGCVPYIELKGISNYQNLITILQQLGMENSCIFQVDNTNDLTTLRTYSKAMALLVGLDTSVPSTLITSLLNYENVGLQLHVATVTED
jgi:glycerophosphoryl diester phosphodiesterase